MVRLVEVGRCMTGEPNVSRALERLFLCFDRPVTKLVLFFSAVTVRLDGGGAFRLTSGTLLLK